MDSSNEYNSSFKWRMLSNKNTYYSIDLYLDELLKEVEF